MFSSIPANGAIAAAQRTFRRGLLTKQGLSCCKETDRPAQQGGKVDISDIAKLAGVSPSTVSKVINHKDESISDKTRDRIRRIVREYHYVPNARARATKGWLLGVLFRSRVSIDSTLDGILSTAQSHGYSTLVFNSDNDIEQECKNLAALRSSGAAGIIWEPVNMDSLERHGGLIPQDAKLVTIGVNGGDRSFLLPYEAAAYEITGELIKRGHSRIACLIREGRRTPDFIRGFRRRLFESGMAFDDTVVYDESFDPLLDRIGRGDVTAVACSHYQLARALNSRLTSLHYHVPEDCSVVSLRNDAGSSWSEDTDEAISTYTIRNAEFGRIACESLIQKVEDRAEPLSLKHGFCLDNENSLGAPPRSPSKRVVVVGSINVDMRLSVSTLPTSGATVSTEKSLTYLGGKGVNQAIGVAKLGHLVTLIGNVGSDSLSDLAYRSLESWDVNTAGVYRHTDGETGRAFIFVDPTGASMIAVLSGANASLHSDDIVSREHLFEGAEYCLVPSEVPMDAVVASCRLARRHGAKTVVKPSAYDHLPAELPAIVDILVPNEKELATICPEGTGIEERAKALRDLGVGTVVVTLGEKGCYLQSESLSRYLPAVETTPVDTTGAGDAFISALTSCLIDGDDIETAAKRASYAAAYSITRFGVANALIDRYSFDCVAPRSNKS